ncbi:MAG: tautomerase family protein [Actinomycetota bacterium]
MPYINVKMYAGRTDEQKREVARRIVSAVMEVCNVSDAAQCPVVIEEITREDWDTSIAAEIAAKRDQQFAP